MCDSQEFKAAIVCRDERESGERAFLNYGHTFAHAVEWLMELDASDDGTPVAIGMMAAAHLSHVQGRLAAADVETHRALLNALGLPTVADIDADRLAGGMEARQEVRPRRAADPPGRHRPADARAHRDAGRADAGPARPGRRLKASRRGARAGVRA
ncbi:3-dehydroquinate synthase family protein [Microbacterium elymi]|uniref:3-dehydroquinate synthase family protein n=1 Tax=Microbacterium elymi TaxID=2909587 RepID=UPI00338F6C33